MTDTTEKRRPVCGLCGSPEVVFEAYALWDDAVQDWTIAMTWDDIGHCHTCGDTSAAWEAIPAYAGGEPS